MSELSEIHVGCEKTSLVIETRTEGVHLIVNRDETEEQAIFVSKDLWPMLKRSIDFAIESNNRKENPSMNRVMS